MDPDFVKGVRRMITCTLRLGRFDETKQILDEYYTKFPTELEDDLRTLAAVHELQKSIAKAAEKEDYKQASFYSH